MQSIFFHLIHELRSHRKFVCSRTKRRGSKSERKKKTCPTVFEIVVRWFSDVFFLIFFSFANVFYLHFSFIILFEMKWNCWPRCSRRKKNEQKKKQQLMRGVFVCSRALASLFKSNFSHYIFMSCLSPQSCCTKQQTVFAVVTHRIDSRNFRWRRIYVFFFFLHSSFMLSAVGRSVCRTDSVWVHRDNDRVALQAMP